MKNSNKFSMKKALLPAICSLAVASSALVGTTYAWFTTSGSSAKVSGIKFNVKSTDGVQIASNLDVNDNIKVNSINWASDLTADQVENNKCTTLTPVSTIGTRSTSGEKNEIDGNLKFYKGTVETSNPDYKLKTIAEADGSEYYYMDVYFNNTANVSRNMYINGTTVTDELNGSGQGASTAMRIAFVNEGNVAGTNSTKELQELHAASSVNIYEPNPSEHTVSGISDFNTYSHLNPYGTTTSTSTTDEATNVTTTTYTHNYAKGSVTDASTFTSTTDDGKQFEGKYPYFGLNATLDSGSLDRFGTFASETTDSYVYSALTISSLEAKYVERLFKNVIGGNDAKITSSTIIYSVKDVAESKTNLNTAENTTKMDLTADNLYYTPVEGSDNPRYYSAAELKEAFTPTFNMDYPDITNYVASTNEVKPNVAYSTLKTGVKKGDVCNISNEKLYFKAATLAKSNATTVSKVNNTDDHMSLVKTLDDDSKTSYFTLPANTASKIRVFIWLEGQDVDCNDSIAISSTELNIDFSFTASEIK